MTSVGAPALSPPVGPFAPLRFRFLCEAPPATDWRALELYRSRFRSIRVDGDKGNEGEFGICTGDLEKNVTRVGPRIWGPRENPS